ncbi:MAG TPA: hypothetical protein VMY78_04455 [Solirubrobacteraceae bacterium]|nr:hypothetical protein [Solirubrobacteraceae bacterium]
MRRLLTRLLAFFGIVRGIVRATHEPPPGEHARDDDADPRSRETPSSPRAERALVALLALAGVAFAAFGVLIAVDADTQLLGAFSAVASRASRPRSSSRGCA